MIFKWPNLWTIRIHFWLRIFHVLPLSLVLLYYKSTQLFFFQLLQHEEDVRRFQDMQQRLQQLQEEKRQQLEQIQRQVRHLEEVKKEIETKWMEAHQISMKEKMRSKELQDCVAKLEEEKRQLQQQNHYLKVKLITFLFSKSIFVDILKKLE